MRLIYKALGSKEGRTDKEADMVGRIRLFMFTFEFITMCFIIAGVWAHWPY